MPQLEDGREPYTVDDTLTSYMDKSNSSTICESADEVGDYTKERSYISYKNGETSIRTIR